MRGTPVYMAPEMWRKEAYGAAADVYSFSLVAWEVFACQKPFPRSWSVIDLFNNIGQGDARPSPMPAAMPARVQQLVIRCWAKDSKTRLRMTEVVTDLESLVEQQ